MVSSRRKPPITTHSKTICYKLNQAISPDLRKRNRPEFGFSLSFVPGEWVSAAGAIGVFGNQTLSGKHPDQRKLTQWKAGSSAELSDDWSGSRMMLENQHENPEVKPVQWSAT